MPNAPHYFAMTSASSGKVHLGIETRGLRAPCGLLMNQFDVRRHYPDTEADLAAVLAEINCGKCRRTIPFKMAEVTAGFSSVQAARQEGR